MNYLQRKKLAFMSIVNQIKGFVRTISGVPPIALSDCVDDNSIIDYKIYGESIQNGEPTPDNPIEIESVGEKTINLFDINSINKMVDIYGNSYNTYMKNENGILTNHMALYGASSGYVVSMKLKKGLYCLSMNARFLKDVPSTIAIGYNFKTASKQTFGGISLEWTRIFYIFELTEDTEITSWNFMPHGNKDNYTKREAQFTNIMLSEISNEDERPDYEPYGKYKIPIIISGNNEPITTNIYLDEPLRKVGDYADYIDFENGKVVRNTALGHITTASFIHSKIADSGTNKGHCCMTMNMLVRSLLCNTPIISMSFPNASNRWSSKIETIFNHTSLDGYLYLKVNWDRLGLVYDGTIVYVEGDETKTPLTDKEIVTYFTKYLNTLSEKEKEFICVGTILEEDIVLPTLSTFKGTTIYVANTTIQPSNMEVTYYSTSKE